MPTNNFLPFSPTDTGTNLLTQSDYAAAADRTIGNQPGVASSKLVNKALRQAAYISSQIAQYIADKTGADVLDDAIPAKLLAQTNAAFSNREPVVTRYTTGSGSHNLSYRFQIASGSATIAATYTNNGITYTVTKTVAAGVELIATGSGAPTVSGTLTKASGTGDSSITFYAVRAPLYLRIRIAGGGGGGGGSSGANSGNGTAGGTGGTSSFGTSLLSCIGGTGGGATTSPGGGAGGTPTVNSPATVVLTVTGTAGANGMVTAVANVATSGGIGGQNPLGGAGSPGQNAQIAGQAGATNSGCGGGGASALQSSALTNYGGGGGGAGAYIEAEIYSPASTYTYAVGAAGTAGSNGTNGALGGAGGSGIIIVQEYFQ